MMCFNLFSHGTQDLYPTFLQKQHEFDQATVSWITIVANLGAIVGGLFFGLISEKIGRVNAITIAALNRTAGAAVVGVFVDALHARDRRLHHADQRSGRVGVIPAHLNELSPGPVRATLPGFVYQAGNFLASYNGPFQARSPSPMAAITVSPSRWSRGS